MKTNTVRCPPGGSGAVIHLDGRIMSTITLAPLPGIGQTLIKQLMHRTSRAKRMLRATSTIVACWPTIWLKLRLQTDPLLPAQLLRRRIQDQRRRRRRLCPVREAPKRRPGQVRCQQAGKSATLLREGRTMSTTTLERQPGWTHVTRESCGWWVQTAHPRVLSPNLSRNLGRYRLDGRCVSLLRHAYTLWTTTRRRRHGTIPVFHHRSTRMYPSTSVTSAANLSTSAANRQCVHSQGTARSKSVVTISSKTVMRRS